MPDTIGAEAPYPGLRPFEPHEADVFFGREAHTDRLLEILQRERFLAVIGPSGSGKSSLVRAGLLPSVRMGALGSGSDWRIAILRPGDQPIRSLAFALLQTEVLGRELAGRETTASKDGEHVAMVTAELRRGPLGLLHIADSVQRQQVNLLVIVDQFEEIFTYAEAGEEHGDESEAFVNLLLTARASASARINVVLTMRTDFLGNCVRFVDLPDAINRAQYLTPRLTRAEMERAIAGPAEVFGGQVEPAVVSEIINATGRNSDQLPLVQHALSRMWSLAATRDPVAPTIGWKDAEAVGGLSGALDQHAETVLRTLVAASPDGEPLVGALFCAITERRAASGGGQDVRRPQTLARIAGACGVDWNVLAPVIEAYAAPGVSLVQHGRRLDADSVIDLSHEALMRQWVRLSRWVDAEARRAAEYRRWTERATEHRNERGGLLEGAALTRALEWRAGEKAAGPSGWRPTAAWAARYAASQDGEAEFAGTLQFIEQSEAHLRRKEQEESDRREREQVAALDRAKAAEEAAKQAQRRARMTRIVAFVLLVMTVTTIYFAIRAREALAVAREESARADASRVRAEVSEQQLTIERDRADRLAKEVSARLDIALDSNAYTASSAGLYTPSSPDAVVPPPGPPTAPGKPATAPDLSIDELASIMPGSTDSLRKAYLAPLTAAMKEFSIDTPLRRAHFLAQMAYESGDLRGTEEKWGPTDQQKRYDMSTSLGRSLGNTQPEDGERYRGRGLIWIVGRGNYEKYGTALMIDLVGQPDLAARPDAASRTAGLFWTLKSLNSLADADDLAGITRRISGAARGLDARAAVLDRVKKVLGVAVYPPP